MPWTFSTTTGLLQHDLTIVGPLGYSGHYNGKNNPAMENIPSIGPIPRGKWRVTGPPIATTKHGPYVLGLWPDAQTETYSRTGFLIHGDSIAKPGTASEGCIVLPRSSRIAIWESDDHELHVV